METKKKKIIAIIFSIIFILVFGVLIPLGYASGYQASDTFYDYSNNGIGGKYLNEALDDMNYYCSRKCPDNKTCTYNTPKCIRATTLHTETCTQTNANNWCSKAGFTSSGSQGTTTITYGNSSTTTGILRAGDAFDCNVDGTGYNQRFYYVSDYYDGSTNNFNTDVAVLLYDSNVSSGVSGIKNVAYDCSKTNYRGPNTAIAELPTISQWSNIRLYKNSRAIVTDYSQDSVNGISLPKNYSYGGYAARFLHVHAVYRGCSNFYLGGGDISSSSLQLVNKCLFLFENSRFANDSVTTSGYWLENPIRGSIIIAWNVSVAQQELNYWSTDFTSSMGVRPAIEILKSEMSY